MAVIYRIIRYEGNDAWMESTLGRSLHGTASFDNGTITVGTIDPADELSITLARDSLFNTIARLERAKPPGFVEE